MNANTPYTGTKLPDGSLFIYPSDDKTLTGAIEKIRRFAANTTGAELQLTAEEFAALRTAKEGDKTLVIGSRH